MENNIQSKLYQAIELLTENQKIMFKNIEALREHNMLLKESINLTNLQISSISRRLEELELLIAEKN